MTCPNATRHRTVTVTVVAFMLTVASCVARMDGGTMGRGRDGA